MSASHPAAFPQPTAAPPARVAIFSFPLTWSFLADFPNAKDLERPSAVPSPIAAQWEPARSIQPEPIQPAEPVRTEPPPADGLDRWEMVVPKMVRAPQLNPGPVKVRQPGIQNAAREQPAPAAAASRPLFQPTPNSASFKHFLFAFLGFLVLITCGFIFFSLRQPATRGTVEVGEAVPVDLAGWVNLTDSPRVSVLRGSMNLTDFRLEFQSQINTKTLGWVFRARDPKNFVVNELEIVKPGSAPLVALKRFAVIGGQDQPVNQVFLPMPLRPDTVYKVRVDAVGGQFTTWVLDQKLDQWIDNRLVSGGVGWYSESGQRQETLPQLSVFSLIRR